MWNWHGNRTGWHVYFSPDENGQGAGSGSANGSGSGGGAGGSSAGTQNTEHMIPKSRFDDINEKYKALEAQLQQQQTDATQREQERLKEEGKWKELAETRGNELAKLQPYQERAQALERAIVEENKARIAQVPESERSLIPEGLSPEGLQSWLNKNWQRLTVPPAPDLDGGAGGGAGGEPLVTPGLLALAKQFNLTPAQLQQAIKEEQAAAQK